jgi:magnesium-protoporphyrin O-methyltransferase
MADYTATRTRVETYFDRTATRTWERLTSDAPVSGVRKTVRAGRDRMRDIMLSRLPQDLRGARVLDAGCGAGQVTEILAMRGADVVAIDISPSLIDIAKRRVPEHLHAQIGFSAGDMFDPALGTFDYVIAMDSMIYYEAADIGDKLAAYHDRVTSAVVFTVAPRTPFLMTFWTMGKMFPQSDRSPVMIPHAPARLVRAAQDRGATGALREVERVTSGFYISTCMEYAT